MYVVSGLFLAAISVPLIMRRIPPNSLYGFRISQTLDNPTLWYSVNEYAGRYLLLTGLGTALGAAVLYLVPGLTVDAYALACLAVVAVLLITSIVQSFRFLRRLQDGP